MAPLGVQSSTAPPGAEPLASVSTPGQPVTQHAQLPNGLMSCDWERLQRLWVQSQNQRPNGDLGQACVTCFVVADPDPASLPRVTLVLLAHRDLREMTEKGYVWRVHM